MRGNLHIHLHQSDELLSFVDFQSSLLQCRSIIHKDSQNSIFISEFHQGDEEREKFHQVYPPPSYDPKNKTEAHILLGEWDTENEKLGVILGVWKPLHPNPVSINKQ